MAYEPVHGPAPQLIETASATTSPDNVNSGSRAYYIALASVIALIVFSSMMGGCVATAFKSVYYLVEDDVLATNWDEVLYEDGNDYHEYDIYEYDDMDTFFDDILEEGNQA